MFLYFEYQNQNFNNKFINFTILINLNMTPNEQKITAFYTALENADSKVVCESYHTDIIFRDPIFGRLVGRDVCQMWKMLIDKAKGNLKIELSEVKADDYLGSALWKATYNLGKNRPITNVIRAEFHFKDGLIIKHTDDFDIWKWAKQALGVRGILFGWTGHMQKKIQEKALLALKKFKIKEL